MRRVFFLVALALACLRADYAPCAAHGTEMFQGLSGELRVAGSDLGLATVEMAARNVMRAHPGVKITTSVTGAGSGLRRVRQRQAEMALYDRSPGEASAESAAMLEFTPYGVDPVAFVVNPANALKDFSLAQVRALFSNKVRSWSEFGGMAAPVHCVFIEASEVEGKPETRPGCVSVSTAPGMRFMVTRNKDFLAYMSVRDMDATVKPLSIDGQTPGLEAFRAGEHRIYRLMYLAVDKNAGALAKAFREYLLSGEGQALLEKTGYMPLAAKPSWESLLPVGHPYRMADGT